MKKNNYFFKKFFPGVFILSLVFSFFFLSVAFAEEALRPEIVIDIGGFNKEDFSQQSSYNCQEGSDDKCIDINWIGQYVSAIYRYGIGLAAILAVVMVMAGGFLWLVSAGSSDKVGKAKEFIFSAITGLTLALFSFIILNAINPNLVNLKSLTVGVPLEQKTVCCKTGTNQYLWKMVPEGQCEKGNDDWENSEDESKCDNIGCCRVEIFNDMGIRDISFNCTTRTVCSNSISGFWEWKFFNIEGSSCTAELCTQHWSELPN